MDHPDSDMDGSMSNNEEEMSDAELQDEDSEDAMRLGTPDAPDPMLLAKLKQELLYSQAREEREVLERELQAHAQAQAQAQSRLPSPPSPRDHPMTPSSVAPMFPPPSLAMPLPFPFQHPAATFLPPISAAPTYNPAVSAPSSVSMQNNVSSASSHSSESSSSSQQPWSFEEQFKQVRQLYELSDDPKRKVFLDDLFVFMTKRGTPINRLPIMAKSVLDLFELYNLVIARGGLVDVINKKLWQEIIKGLHLPSSITSAAFTLRTQYMKYLYPYECEKRRLSTPQELQAAIDGNRREGRRSSYGTYSEMIQRSPIPPHPSQMSPLSLVTGGRTTMNGNSNHHHPSSLHPSHPAAHSQPLPPGPIPALAASELESQMAHYVKILNKELRNAPRENSNSPPSSTLPQDALRALEMSRITLWNLYNNNTTQLNSQTAVEPQKEALNLEVKEQQAKQSQEAAVKRENEELPLPPPAKRLLGETESVKKRSHIKIDGRGGGGAGVDSQIMVTMEIDGVVYEGVLFATEQTMRESRTHMT